MEATLRKWTIMGVIIVFLLAGAWHFLYDVLPCNFIGVISPVNESPWEHAKLFFVPAIIWYVIMYFIVGKDFSNYVFGHSIALLVMPIIMLLLFYLYRPLLEETLPLDLLNAVVTIAVGAFVAYKLTVSQMVIHPCVQYVIATVIIIGMLVIYTVFTFHPPRCDLFFDRSTMRYGI